MHKGLSQQTTQFFFPNPVPGKPLLGGVPQSTSSSHVQDQGAVFTCRPPPSSLQFPRGRGGKVREWGCGQGPVTVNPSCPSDAPEGQPLCRRRQLQNETRNSSPSFSNKSRMSNREPHEDLPCGCARPKDMPCLLFTMNPQRCLQAFDVGVRQSSAGLSQLERPRTALPRPLRVSFPSPATWERNSGG